MYRLIASIDAKPPIAGPNTKPNPIAMPTIPMAFARSRPEDTSAAAAAAVAMLPAIAPPNSRDATSNAKLPAKPHIRYANTVPAVVSNSVLRRPMRSESPPHTTENTNCMPAYSEPKMPPNSVTTALSSSPANCFSQSANRPTALSAPSSHT